MTKKLMVQIDLLLKHQIYIENKKNIYIKNAKDIKLELENHTDLFLKDEIYKSQSDIENGIINILKASLKKFIKIKVVGSSYITIKENIENIKKEIIKIFITIFNSKTNYFKIFHIYWEVDVYGEEHNPYNNNNFKMTIVGKETKIIFYN